MLPCPPSHCGSFKKRKGLTALAVCIDTNLFPTPPIIKKKQNRNPLEESPLGARVSRSAVLRLLLVWLWKGGSLSVVMKWKSSSAMNACTPKIIGDVCHPKKLGCSTSRSLMMFVDSFLTGMPKLQLLGWRYYDKAGPVRFTALLFQSDPSRRFHLQGAFRAQRRRTGANTNRFWHPIVNL